MEHVDTLIFDGITKKSIHILFLKNFNSLNKRQLKERLSILKKEKIF